MTNKQIKLWMRNNAHRFVDAKTGEVNMISMVEAWDSECDTGKATLDSDHPSWEIAVEVSDERKVSK